MDAQWPKICLVTPKDITKSFRLFFLLNHLLSTSSIPADLPTHDYIIFPQHTAHTNQCLILWCGMTAGKLTIAELTIIIISFESSMDVAHQIKIFRHSKVINFGKQYYTLEIGSWGLLHMTDFQKTHACTCKVMLPDKHDKNSSTWIIQNLVL